MTGYGDEQVMKAIADLAQAEISGTAEPVTVRIGPFSMFQLIGAVQLALRHPNMPASVREMVTNLAREFATCFNEGSIARQVVEAGFDPDNDVPS